MKLAKYALSILFCNAYRLLRFIPNNDPIMGCMLPFARRDKAWKAALFAFITMASFDFITMKAGAWTIVTAGTYALLALVFGLIYNRMKTVKLRHYLGSGISGVLIFDFITGPIMSSYLFKIPFSVAFVGQIPFTILHLLTVSGFILILTPILDKLVVANPQLEDSKVLNKFRFFART